MTPGSVRRGSMGQVSGSLTGSHTHTHTHTLVSIRGLRSDSDLKLSHTFFELLKNSVPSVSKVLRHRGLWKVSYSVSGKTLDIP
jgi:hypothetical protein